jgi:hypothetical protein
MTPDFALTGLKAVATRVGSIVTWRQQNAEKKDAKTDEALKSLMKAALETRHYLALIRDTPQARDKEKEQTLAGLWAAAGSDMLHIDSDLAMRYLMKADYWSDTEGGTAADNDERLIQLDDVLRLGREALVIPSKKLR